MCVNLLRCSCAVNVYVNAAVLLLALCKYKYLHKYICKCGCVTFSAIALKYHAAAPVCRQDFIESMRVCVCVCISYALLGLSDGIYLPFII